MRKVILFILMVVTNTIAAYSQNNHNIVQVNSF